MEKEKLFYTLREIREEIYGQEISLATLQNMVHAGQIPSIRVMRRIFIPVSYTHLTLPTNREV